MFESRTLALLLAGGALLAGCGSSGAGSSGSSSSRAPYVAQANRICAAQVALLHRLRRPTSPEQALSYLPQVLAIMRTETTQLGALDPQSADGSELKAALASTRQLSAVLSHFLHQLKTGIVELTTFTQVQQQSNVVRQQIDAHFRHAGLPSCVQ